MLKADNPLLVRPEIILKRVEQNHVAVLSLTNGCESPFVEIVICRPASSRMAAEERPLGSEIRTCVALRRPSRHQGAPVGTLAGACVATTPRTRRGPPPPTRPWELTRWWGVLPPEASPVGSHPDRPTKSRSIQYGIVFHCGGFDRERSPTANVDGLAAAGRGTCGHPP